MQEVNPVSSSMLSWMLSALGPVYAILLPSVALVCFVFTLLIVIRGRGPMASAALVFVVCAPLLIGGFAAIHGALDSYRVIATAATSPKPSQWAEGVSTALVAPLTALLLAMPSYVIATLGALVRSLLARDESTKPG